MSIKVRLINVQNFLQILVWGSWLISLGGYMGREPHSEGVKTDRYPATMCPPLAISGIIGIIADKWSNAERLYGLCHIAGAACFSCPTVTNCRPDALLGHATQFIGIYAYPVYCWSSSVLHNVTGTT